MRIISGLLKRQRFNPPKGFPSRPTTDFAKEGLFNILVNEKTLDHLEILDLFAGTGNISFEFASREAGKITAVDQNFKCVKFIKDFAKKHQLDKVTTIKADAVKFVAKTANTYDLIFADPPYELTIHQDIIDIVFERELLKKEGLLIVEHGKDKSFEEHPSFYHERKYGHVVFSFFKKS